MKKEVIEQITYKHGNQSICHRKIYTYKNLKIKLELRSDSYRPQCYARASVLDGLNWNIIYNIPATQMKTGEGLIYAVPYRNNADAAEKEFKQDVERLEKYIESIL